MAMDKKHCAGCEDDFYNGKNPLGVKECWSLKDAEVVTRYSIGTWTEPTRPGAFREVQRPNCYHRKGEHFYKRLPDFVREEDVIRPPPAKASDGRKEEG